MTLLITYLIIAVGISFLCSILEAVLLSLTPSYIEKTRADRPRVGGVLVSCKEKIDESLSAILILNTFAHTMGAAGVGSQALQVFGKEWETLIAVVLTLIILYFSEIIPKTLGATFWRQLAIPSAFIISWLVKLVFPLIWIATLITRLIHRKNDNEVSREEIIALASLSLKEGVIQSQENEYLHNMLHLREVKTEEILTPRSVVHFLQEATSVSDALNDPKTRQFSRIPVYGEDIDDIKGKVHRADLFEAERDGKGNTPVSQVCKPLLRVSEKLPVHSLLDLCIKKQVHLVLVEDEFGQTAGVAALEDAIETLLGREIIDERDTVEDMQQLAKNKYRNRLRKRKE